MPPGEAVPGFENGAPLAILAPVPRRSLPAKGRWCVYILECGDGSLYTGATNDLARRVERHGAGRGAAYTRSRLPVRLVFWERAAGLSEALRREAAVKRLSRPQKLLLLPGDPPPRRRGI